ncbi:uncharacterized protein LOC144108595 [Amblyomma americanum]
MKSTASTRKPKPFIGLTCIQGDVGEKRLNHLFVFSICQRLVAELDAVDFAGRVDVTYGFRFTVGGTENYKKYVDYIHWVWYYRTIASYSKNLFKRFPLLTYTHRHFGAYGITHVPFEKVFETIHMQQFIDSMRGVAPDKLILLIDYYLIDMEMPTTIDTTKFDGYGHVVVLRGSYDTCTHECLWYDKKYLDFSIALNNFLDQPVTIATTGGYKDSGEKELLPGGDCWYWDPELSDITSINFH